MAEKISALTEQFEGTKFTPVDPKNYLLPDSPDGTFDSAFIAPNGRTVILIKNYPADENALLGAYRHILSSLEIIGYNDVVVLNFIPDDFTSAFGKAVLNIFSLPTHVFAQADALRGKGDQVTVFRSGINNPLAQLVNRLAPGTAHVLHTASVDNVLGVVAEIIAKREKENY